MIIKRKELLEKLNVSRTCLATQDIIPVLTHFCFDKDKITSFNTGQAVILDCDTGLSGCVPGDLIKLLGSYGTDDVSITQTETNITVKSGRSSVKLNTLPRNIFPFKLADDVMNTDKQHDLTEDFFEGIKQVALSMGNNASLRNQYGITVISAPEKTTLYSSDRARVSSFTLSEPLKSVPFTILLPKAFCDTLISVSKDFKSGKLYVGKDSILVDFLVDGKSAGIQLYSNFIADIDFIPFESILSQVVLSNDKFQPVPSSLLNCIDRNLILISSDKNPEIEIKTEGKIMTITSSNDHGTVVDEIEFTDTLGDIICKMKPIFLRQAVLASNKISFSNFDGDIVLVGINENFLHLVSSVAD